MKPSEDAAAAQEASQPTGDVIGDTAYSERFVLKILLKFANTDTLQEELQEQSFEEELCTLWDMTTEKDVVLFLLKHDFIKLAQFSLPSINSDRICEILIGIIGNMCCFEEAIQALEMNQDFVEAVVKFVSSDDSLIIIQVVRLIHACVHKLPPSNISQWINIFKNTAFNMNLGFILKNSSNKSLLIACLDCLNSICTNCNIDPYTTDFFNLFVTADVIEAIIYAFNELVEREEDLCEEDELSRIFLTILQIKLTLTGFNKSPELYMDHKDNITSIINKILNHIKSKVAKKEIDLEIIDIFDSINVIWSSLSLEVPNEMFFNISYEIWKSLDDVFDNTNSADFEGEDQSETKKIITDLMPHLCSFLCKCLSECNSNDLETILVLIESDYERILNNTEDETIKQVVVERTTDIRARLKENVKDT